MRGDLDTGSEVGSRAAVKRVVVILAIFSALLITNLLWQRFFYSAWSRVNGGPPVTPDLERVVRRDTIRFWFGVIGLPGLTLGTTALLAGTGARHRWHDSDFILCLAGLGSTYLQLVWTGFWFHDTRVPIAEGTLRSIESLIATGTFILPLVAAILAGAWGLARLRRRFVR